MLTPDIFLSPTSPVGIVGKYEDLQAIIQAVGPEMARKPGSVAVVAGLSIEMLPPEATESLVNQHQRNTGESVTVVDLLPQS